MTKQLQNMLTEFFICEIKSKAMDGVTYAMVLDNGTQKEQNNLKKYRAICEEASRCGYRSDELFRGYKIANGFIFDMDIGIAKGILMNIISAVNNTNGDSGNTNPQDVIGDSPDKYRKSDMLALARYVKSEFESGKNKVEVALYNRNANPKIIMTVKNTDGSNVTIKYNAYAIRHWDIEIINDKLLIPAGIRISRLEPCEILPLKNGVTFNLYLEAC